MGITSIGVFGYLSAAYQINSSKFAQIDSQLNLLKTQKDALVIEAEQNRKRIEILNTIRIDQEKRVKEAGNYKVPREQAYAAIKEANDEIQILTNRNQELQEQQLEKDNSGLQLSAEISKTKDIGTFKFVSETTNKPLDVVVIAFICVLICVFDPLAVTLLLAFNIAIKNKEISYKSVETEQDYTNSICVPAPTPTVNSTPDPAQHTTEEQENRIVAEVESTLQISPEPTSRIWFSPEVDNRK